MLALFGGHSLQYFEATIMEYLLRGLQFGIQFREGYACGPQHQKILCKIHLEGT